MSLELLASIPIIVGLIGVGYAIFERAYKTFLEKKQVDPKLEFNAAYLTNALISTGIGVTVVTAIVPALIAELTGAATLPITIGSIILNAIAGYGLTYRILDGLNKGTSKEIQIEELKEEVK